MFLYFLSLLLHQTPPLTGRRRTGGIGQRSATKRVDVVQIGIPSCFWSAKPDKIAAKAANKMEDVAWKIEDRMNNMDM